MAVTGETGLRASPGHHRFQRNQALPEGWRSWWRNAAALLLFWAGSALADGRVCVVYVTEDRSRDFCVDTPPVAHRYLVAEPVQQITLVRELTDQGEQSYSWLGGAWVSVPGEFRVFTLYRQYVIAADFLLVYASLDPIFTASD